MPWAPPAPAHSSRRSWSSSRVFQPSFQLVEAPVPPAGDPQQPLAAMCQRPPAGGSAGHELQGKHFPLDRLGASSSCICLQRKKKNQTSFSQAPPTTQNFPASRGIQGTPRTGPQQEPQHPAAPSSHRHFPPRATGAKSDRIPVFSPLQRPQKLGSLPRHFPKLWALGSALPLAAGTAKRSCDKSTCPLVTLGANPAFREFPAGSGLAAGRSRSPNGICREAKPWLAALFAPAEHGGSVKTPRRLTPAALLMCSLRFFLFSLSFFFLGRAHEICFKLLSSPNLRGTHRTLSEAPRCCRVLSCTKALPFFSRRQPQDPCPQNVGVSGPVWGGRASGAALSTGNTKSTSAATQGTPGL